MKLYFFERQILNGLPAGEREIYLKLAESFCVPNGRPFFIGEDQLPDPELDGFCEYLIVPRRKSSNTWSTYANHVSVFLRFMKAQGKSWKEASSDDLKKYYKVRSTGEFQTGSKIKGQSWNSAKTAIVHLYEYALDENLIEKAPYKYRKSKSLFAGEGSLTADLNAKPEIEPINFIGINQYKNQWRPLLTKNKDPQRNLGLSDLLITVGLRISEALSLQVSQIPDPDDLSSVGRKSVSIRVVGKGSKPRMVLIPKRIIRALRFYIDEDRESIVEKYMAENKKAKRPTALFLSNRGTPLKPRTAQIYFKKISDEIGIRLTPHGCRHTYAVYQLEAMIKRMALNLRNLRDTGSDAYRQIMNDPLRQLQLLLGHSSITHTYIYLDFLEESEILVEESLNDWTSWGKANGE